MSSNSDTDTATLDSREEPVWLSIVREHVDSLRFGVVQIVIHEGRVTQVDATNRTRIEPDEGRKSAVSRTSRKASGLP